RAGSGRVRAGRGAPGVAPAGRPVLLATGELAPPARPGVAGELGAGAARPPGGVGRGGGVGALASGERTTPAATDRRRDGHRDPKKTLGALGVGAAPRGGRRAMMAEAVTLLAPAVGVGAACAALAVPRASWYRWSAPPATAPAGLAARPTAHPRALSAAE